jgi:tetratricopeptide (TPR) repeat protein
MTADSIAFYLAQGQYDAMAAECEQGIANDPECLSSYWYLGLARLLQGDEAEAQAVWFAATTAVEPEAMEAGIAELSALLQTEVDRQLAQGRPDLAERLCWQLLEIDSEQAIYHLQLGQCVALQARFEEAIDHWQTALTLQPDCGIAYQKQGEVFQTLEQWDEAVTAYARAIELQPSWESHYQLGICLGRQERWQEALTQFEQVIQLRPDYAAAYGDRGWAFLQQGDWQAAIADFKTALCHISGMAQPYCAWVETLSEATRSHQVSQNAQFFNALCTEPELAATYFALGQYFAQNRDWQRAIEAYHRALQHQPASAEILTALGNALVVSNPQAAIEAYETALRHQPESAEACLRLGRLLVVHDRDRAIALFQKATQLQPDMVDAYVLLARWSNANEQEKIALYQQALALQPNRIDALLNLSYVLAEMGELDATIEGFQRALSLQPHLYKTIKPALESLLPADRLEQNSDFDRLADSVVHRILSLADSPTSFYETTEAWATQTPDSDYIALDPPSVLELTLPKGIDCEAHVSYRFGREIQLPGTFVATIPNGQFWLNPDQTTSAVLSAENHLLGDLSPEFPLLSPGHPDKHSSLHSLLSTEKRSPQKKLDGTIAVLAGLTNDMYFHWMFDVLPRINLLHRSGIDLQQINGFVVSDHLSFQQETLRLLDIPEQKILPTERYSHIQADRLIIPSYPGSPAWMPKWVCDWLRDVFLGDISAFQGSDRLYISRQSTATRRVINEREIIEFLAQFGFQFVTLEGRSVKEQAALLANASVVISPHGGGLTNTVFCRPGTKVIELFAPNYVYPCYWLVSNLLNLNYYYLIGKMPAGNFLYSSLYPDSRLADIWIDLNDLQATLNLAHVIES